MKSLFAKRIDCCLAALLALVPVMPSASYATSLTLDIDAEKKVGPVPELLTSSIWVQQINEQEEHIYEKFFSENKPAVVQLSLPVLAATRDFAGFKQALRGYMRSSAATALISNIRSRDSILIIGFDPCPMPAWLSSRPGDKRNVSGQGAFDSWATMESCSPPRDYSLWAEVVTETLHYFRTELRVGKLGYYVGHEQELQWAGSEQDFFDYYEHTARAVKSIGAEIKVGGVGPAIWNKGKYGCDHLNPEIQGICRQGAWKGTGDEPFLKQFIDYAGRRKAPLDFINLHSFGTLPRQFLELVPTIKGWLASRGLTRVPIYISDWTAWNGPYPSEALDTPEAAAYIPQALYYMWKSGVTWHGHDFNVRNSHLEAKDGPATFTGDWPLFTKDFIVKPSYNAFRALTIFSGARERSFLLDVALPERSNVVAFASRQDNDRVAVLASYFVPGFSSVMFKSSFLLEMLKQENMFKSIEHEIDLVVDCMKSEHREQSKKRRAAFCLDSVSNGISLDKKSQLTTVYGIYAAFGSAHPLDELRTLADQSGDDRIKTKITKFSAAVGELSRTVNLRLQTSNLPFTGKAVVSIYRIDQDHANPCEVNRKTSSGRGKEAICGVGGVVDKKVSDAKLAALREAAAEMKKDLERFGLDERKLALTKAHIDQCLSAETFGESARCLKAKINNAGDLKSKMKTGLDSFVVAYARRTDTINELDSLALVPARQTIDIKADRSFSYDGQLPPNSVLLMVIEKADR